MHKRILGLIPFLIWPLFASIVSILLHFSYIPSMFLFLGVPAIYLSVKLPPKLIEKVSLFSLLTVIPFVTVADWIAHFTKQWWVLYTVFPRILGYISIEDIIWGILFAYFVIMFYEYFVESQRDTHVWHSRMKIAVGILWGLLGVFFVCYFISKDILNIPYFYLLIGIVFMFVPSAIELLRHPSLLPKFAVTATYFFFLTFVYEITALKLNQWTFPSNQYIGWISLFGVRFPFEEFIFGFIFYTLTALSLYESFDDDER